MHPKEESNVNRRIAKHVQLGIFIVGALSLLMAVFCAGLYFADYLRPLLQPEFPTSRFVYWFSALLLSWFASLGSVMLYVRILFGPLPSDEREVYSIREEIIVPNGPLGNSGRCPKCQFAFAFNGKSCRHCGLKIPQPPSHPFRYRYQRNHSLVRPAKRDTKRNRNPFGITSA
jgi:hypothetical protein